MRKPDEFIRDDEIDNKKLDGKYKKILESSYDIRPYSVQELMGKEVGIIDDTGNEWMGGYGRDMIENSRKEDDICVGYTQKDGGIDDVCIDYESLSKHIAIFGQTGYGKSTLVRNIMLQYITAGYGACYIDPKGDDAKRMMRQIPSDRTDDIIWIEPGSGEDLQVGFNILNTVNEPSENGYEKEVETLSANFIATLQSSVDGKIDSETSAIVESIVEKLIRSDKEYDATDLASILGLISNESSQNFPERFVELKDKYGEFADKELMMRVANRGTDGIERLYLHLTRILKNRPTRSLIAHSNHSTTLQDAVRKENIIVIDLSNLNSPPVAEFVSDTVISQIWHAARSREKTDGDPYFLAVDEFDKIIDNTPIEQILSQARSERLSVLLSCQQPSQLSKSVKNSLQQIQSILSFHSGQNPRDQSNISRLLGDVDAWKLGDLRPYIIAARTYSNGRQMGTRLVRTYPEYPPVRNEEKAKKIVEESVRKYGGKPDDSLLDF